jgi:hypothetical protein
MQKKVQIIGDEVLDVSRAVLVEVYISCLLEQPNSIDLVRI